MKVVHICVLNDWWRVYRCLWIPWGCYGGCCTQVMEKAECAKSDCGCGEDLWHSLSSVSCVHYSMCLFMSMFWKWVHSLCTVYVHTVVVSKQVCALRACIWVLASTHTHLSRVCVVWGGVSQPSGMLRLPRGGRGPLLGLWLLPGWRFRKALCRLHICWNNRHSVQQTTRLLCASLSSQTLLLTLRLLLTTVRK